MNTEQLNQMKSAKGFIAALDQSGGSTPKALKGYGIYEKAYQNDDEMFDLVHQMRTRIIKSPAFGDDRIIGAILFENTMDRKIDDLYTADFLWKRKRVVPFLKIDKGLAPIENGVQLMKEIPGLDQLLQKAVERNIFGTKMRSVIKEANDKGIQEIVSQQFEIAKQILSYGLIPIIEPEVDINSPEKLECEHILKKYLQEKLSTLDEADRVIFKLSIPSIDNFYTDLISESKVIRVVALSGGYSRIEANAKLARNQGLIASFSRALAEGLSAQQSEEEFNNTLYTSIESIYKASL